MTYAEKCSKPIVEIREVGENVILICSCDVKCPISKVCPSISYKKKRRDLSNDIELRMLFLAIFRGKKERKKFFLLYVFAKLK